jgi:proline-specific peptidase
VGKFAFFMASTTIISTEGTIPFNVDGETHQTWFKVFGDLTNRTRTPVVVLHGGPGYSHDYLLPISDLASSTSPVIFYDQLGHSRSTHLPEKPQSFWSIDLFIDELVNLLTYFNIQDEFDLLGHSWGGMLAVEFEIRRQHAGLRRMILSDSLAAMHLWNEAKDQLKSAFPAEVQEGMGVGLKDLERFRTSMFIYLSVHGCTVQPMPEELKYSLGQFFDDDADRSVSNAM